MLKTSMSVSRTHVAVEGISIYQTVDSTKI
jgi:hypothetical protein